MTRSASVAANLRKILKDKFPGTKFSVKSKNYSGGDSVTVYWSFGPTKEEVPRIADTFQDGDFDGMTDMYNYRESHYDVTTEGKLASVERAKYVFCNREYDLQDGRNAHDLVKVWVSEHYAGTNEYDNNRIAWEILAKSPLPNGFHGVKDLAEGPFPRCPEHRAY